MTDIVERLRAGGCRENMGCKPDICVCAMADDAADEIERLRARIADLEEQMLRALEGLA